MRLVALDVAVEMVESLGRVVPMIEAKDRNLGEQMRRAASSAVLNTAEGARRAGRDRAHAFRIAHGEASEVAAALRVAVAWGHIGAEAVEAPLARLDRLGGLLYGLIRKR
jgi:four helix bundle protein